MVIINQLDNNNFVRLYKQGEFMFEWRDNIISDIKFVRIIGDQKFTFENEKLISTEIMSVKGYLFRYRFCFNRK